jgi:hypothetical protein
MQLSDIIFESNILPKHCHLCLLSVFSSSHGLSGSEPEPATVVRSQDIWSQSHNSSLAPLIYGSAHMASSFEPSRGNTTQLSPQTLTKQFPFWSWAPFWAIILGAT